MSDDEKKLFDEIVLKLLAHTGGDESVEKAAVRIIEARRAFFDHGKTPPHSTPPPKPFGGWDHLHEVGSCSHCDASTASITDPSKPTKPTELACACKRSADRHIQTVKGDGWLDCDGLVRLYR